MVNAVIYSPTFIETLFNGIAGSYTQVNSLANFNLPKWISEKYLIQSIPDTKAIKILDLMCGTGENWAALLHHYPNAQITAVDLSEEMIHLAQIRNANEFKHTVELIHHDILDMQFKQHEYDLIVCSYGLKCISLMQLDKLMQIINTTLKPNGKTVFLEVVQAKHWFISKVFKFHFKYYLPLLSKLLYKSGTKYKMLWEYMNNFNESQVLETIKRYQPHAISKHYLLGNLLIIES